jgi:hypothetical protein
MFTYYPQLRRQPAILIAALAIGAGLVGSPHNAAHAVSSQKLVTTTSIPLKVKSTLLPGKKGVPINTKVATPVTIARKPIDVTTGDGPRMDVVKIIATGGGIVEYTIGYANRDRTFDYRRTNLGDQPIPIKVFLADVSGDGLSDLVMLNPAVSATKSTVVATTTRIAEPRTNEIAIAINEGNARFRWKLSNLSNVTNNMTVGDLNGDNRSDLLFATANQTGTFDYSIAFSNGDATFDVRATGAQSRANPVYLKVADTTGDGRNDIIAFEDLGNAIGRIMVGVINPPTAITFTEAYTGPLPQTHIGKHQAFDAGDFNADAQAEVMIANTAGNGLFVFAIGTYDTSTARFVWRTSNMSVMSSQSGAAFKVSDFTGDGRADVYTHDADKGQDPTIGISNGTDFLLGTVLGSGLQGNDGDNVGEAG